MLCKQDETTLLTHKPVLQYSAVSLSTVLRSDFPSLVEDAIRVVAKARASVLAVEAWKVFDRALVAQIPLDQTHRILQLLRDLVLAARTASRPVYLPWVHPLCDFVYELVKVHAKASPNSEVPLTLEDETYAMYDTWLRVSPDLGGTPWSEKSARDQNVRALVSFFADTVVLFGSVTGGEAFSRVWGWLAPLLAKGTCAPSFVRDPVFHAFAGVSWKLWSPSAADVALAVDALQDPAVASPALAELLLRAANDVTWETLDFASTPSFLGKAALWAAAVVCRAPRAAEPAVEKMIQGWILPMDWAVTATDAEFHSALAAEWSTTLFPALRSHAQNKDELRMRGQKLLLLLMKACLVVGPGSTLAVEEEEEEEEENSAINDEDRKRARRKEDFARLEMFVKALTGIRGLTDDDNIGVYPDCAAAAFESYVRLAVKEQEPEDNNNDANDDNNVEPEIGNTESADEVTPAGTPVVDDVVDIPTVTADNDEEVESLKKNLRMLFSLYNCPQSKAIRSVVRGVLERHPDVVPEFLSVACETVSSVSILASAVNEMIDAYFYSSVVDSLPYAERSWDSVSAALRLSGKKAEFVGGCLTTGSLLALYAFHRMTRVNPSRTEKYEYQTWLLTMPLVAGKREHQLLLVTFGVLERAVTSISNVCSGDNGEEEKEGEEKEEKEKEDEEEAAVKKERFTKVVTKTAEILEKLGEDRSKEGFKGFFGRGEVSPFSAKLRLSTKVLAIFLSSQIVGGNSGSPNTVASVRTDSTTPLDKSVTVAAKKRVASLLDSLPKDKSYTAEMTPTAITTLLKKLDDMVSDSEVTVRSFGELFTEIVRNLYQEKLEFYPLLN